MWKKSIYACFILALIIILSGCSPQFGTTPSHALSQESPYTAESFKTAEIVLKIEHSVYKNDVERISYTLTNTGREAVPYTQGYEVERFEEGKWLMIPSEHGIDSNSVEGVINGGEVLGGGFSPKLFNYTWSDGKYRLIIKANNSYCNAEFSIGDSKITAATPYGYSRQEDLPAGYSIEEAIANGDFVVTPTGYYNEEKIRDFLAKLNLRIPAMLRTVQSTTEGESIITDYIASQQYNEYFQIVQDRSRTKDGLSAIKKETYGYVSLAHINGQDVLCFSDYTSFKELAPADETEYFLADELLKVDVNLLQEVESLIAQNRLFGHKYRSRSSDGQNYAIITAQQNGSDTVQYFYGSVMANTDPTLAVPKTQKTLKKVKWLDNQSFEIIGSVQEMGSVGESHPYYAVFNAQKGKYTSEKSD